MQSTLIRFTDSKFADSYRTGDLYLSSISSFWDLTKDTLPYDPELVKLPEAEIRKRLKEKGAAEGRQDFSEGVMAQIPRDKISQVFGDMRDHVIHDVRFRLSAYKYCNILCFFRIDAEDSLTGLLDEENVSYLAKDMGIMITPEELTSNAELGRELADRVSFKNAALSPHLTHTVQLPSVSMNDFGDTVIVIKNEAEFRGRIIAAVKQLGDHCIMGDIRYHELEDRVDPSTLGKHCVSLVSSGCGDNKELSKNWLSENGTFDVSMLDGIEDIYWRGCLDKYDRFAKQKEWRVCWLPSELNYEAKILHVGSLEDIIDIVPTKDIRRYLLKKYSGYVPGIITNNRRTIAGTESYGAFKTRMRDIDGTGEFVVEIG